MKKLISLALALIIAAALPFAVSAVDTPPIIVSTDGAGTASYEVVNETDTEITLNVTFNPDAGYETLLLSVSGNLGAFEEPLVYEEFNGNAPESIEFTVEKDYKSITLLIMFVESGASFLKGDLDGDGEITVSDALKALRIAAKLVDATEDDIAIGDTDGDGEITVSDALKILRVAAKLAGPESLQ